MRRSRKSILINIICIFMLCVVLLVDGCAKKKTRRYKLKNDRAPHSHEIPKNLLNTPDATPKHEAKSKCGNKQYKVFNKTYNVLGVSKGYKEKGYASWYGKKFHGYHTSSGEVYNMFGMTAAHRTLPLPTYAIVKNLDNGKEVIVKINDRGPFHGNRLIDLSYAAAAKLGIVGHGTAHVEVKAVDVAQFLAQKNRFDHKPDTKSDNRLASTKIKNRQLIGEAGSKKAGNKLAANQSANTKVASDKTANAKVAVDRAANTKVSSNKLSGNRLARDKAPNDKIAVNKSKAIKKPKQAVVAKLNQMKSNED